ncbi:hypothetical protein M9458_038158, partial [Cirrhinus mrigala]
AYTASGQAASALHATAILRAFRPWRCEAAGTAYNDRLRSLSYEVVAHALGRVMSTLLVQERHLWLHLSEMWENPSGDTVIEFARKSFTVVKKSRQRLSCIQPQLWVGLRPSTPDYSCL